MISSSKLKRIKNRENLKAEREKCLLSLKQSALPYFEPQTRAKNSKCNKCCEKMEHYGLTFEWMLEPIDVLKITKDYLVTRPILSSIMTSLIVHPAELQTIKFLQESRPEHSIIFVMNSENMELGQSIVKFIMKSFDLKIPYSIYDAGMDNIKEALAHNSSIIVSDETHLHAITESIEFGESRKVYWLPISIGYENFDSIPFKFSLSNFIRKLRNGYGMVKVTFHEPYTYSDFFQRRSFNGKFLRNHLYHDIVFKAPVMATNLVAFLLLTYFKDAGGKVTEIAEKANELQKNFCTIEFAFEGDAIDVVNYALKTFHSKISIDKEGFIKANEDAYEEFLSLAKVLLFHHALKAALVSYLTLSRVDYNKVDYYKMIDHASNVVDKLKIPFKGCSTKEDQLIDAFDNLAINGLMKRPIRIYTENEQRALRMAKYLDVDEDDDYEDGSYNDDESVSDEEEEFDPNNQVIINIDMENEINVLKDMILLIQGSDETACDDEDEK